MSMGGGMGGGGGGGGEMGQMGVQAQNIELDPVDIDIAGTTAEGNNILQRALLGALAYSEKYTDRAAAIQKDYYRQALTHLKQARQDQIEGDKRSQARQAPYREAGYQALDRYMDTLSMARPEMGSSNLSRALEGKIDYDRVRGKLQNLYSGLAGMMGGYNLTADNPISADLVNLYSTAVREGRLNEVMAFPEMRLLIENGQFDEYPELKDQLREYFGYDPWTGRYPTQNISQNVPLHDANFDPKTNTFATAPQDPPGSHGQNDSSQLPSFQNQLGRLTGNSGITSMGGVFLGPAPSGSQFFTGAGLPGQSQLPLSQMLNAQGTQFLGPYIPSSDDPFKIFENDPIVHKYLEGQRVPFSQSLDPLYPIENAGAGYRGELGFNPYDASRWLDPAEYLNAKKIYANFARRGDDWGESGRKVLEDRLAAGYIEPLPEIWHELMRQQLEFNMATGYTELGRPADRGAAANYASWLQQMKPYMKELQEIQQYYGPSQMLTADAYHKGLFSTPHLKDVDYALINNQNSGQQS